MARVRFPAAAVISLSLRDLAERLRHVALKWAGRSGQRQPRDGDGVGDMERMREPAEQQLSVLCAASAGQTCFPLRRRRRHVLDNLAKFRIRLGSVRSTLRTCSCCNAR